MSSGIRVLHVDDEPGFRDLSSRFLDREDIDVTTAESATAALEKLDKSIDCVVSDYDMPPVDGLEFLEKVRERDPELPFILFTGKGSEEIASEAIGAGVTDYLQKETTAEQFALLANRIERAVTERRTEAALEESERMLSTLVSNLPGIVYRCENAPDWAMEYINGTVTEITGYEPTVFLDGDRTWGDLINDASKKALWLEIQEAVEARESFEVTYRITDADGETRWIREQGQGVFESPDTEEPVALEGFITDITDRKRRQRELSEYDRLVDALGAPVYTTDREGRFTTFNERAEELTGYDADEVLGEHVSILLEGSEIERSEAVIRELLRDDDQATASYDLTVETADGVSLAFENRLALLRSDGEYRGAIGVLRSAEDRTDTRLRQLHEATRELVIESDAERIAERTTRAAREILDLPIASVRLEDGDVLTLVASTDQTVQKMGERPPYPIEDSVPGEAFRDGETRLVPDLEELSDGIDRGEARSSVYVPLGEHGLFIASSTEPDDFDETDVRLATILAANTEAALDRAEKQSQLRRERDDLAALFENIPDPTVEVVMRNGNPIVERVNPAFEETFGYSNETVRGANLDEYIVPDTNAGRVSEYNARIEEGEGFHGEVRRLAEDGLRDFILHVVPHDVDTDGTRGYAIYTDITEQKQRERKLQRQNERLDQFASVVSHDLKNPLSVARGRLELARMTGDDEHFDGVDRAHDRMDELIDGLLTLARQGEISDDAVSVELESAAQIAWETVDTGELALSVEESPTVIADPERLRQLLENLFGNAVEHASATTVTVGKVDDDSFYVEDDGVGIPKSERDNVLDSGYSTDDSTGFGLAIVDTIAEAHGWSVTVTESDSGGARFEFRDGTGDGNPTPS